MQRLTPGKVAVIIERIRASGSAAATDADLLAEHIDALAGENKFLEHFQRMTEVTSQSLAAESATRDAIAGMQPVLATAITAFDRRTRVEERRIALEEAAAKRDEASEAAAAKREEAAAERKYQHIIGPIVAAIVTFVATASAFYFATP